MLSSVCLLMQAGRAFFLDKIVGPRGGEHKRKLVSAARTCHLQRWHLHLHVAETQRCGAGSPTAIAFAQMLLKLCWPECALGAYLCGEVGFGWGSGAVAMGTCYATPSRFSVGFPAATGSTIFQWLHLLSRRSRRPLGKCCDVSPASSSSSYRRAGAAADAMRPLTRSPNRLRRKQRQRPRTRWQVRRRPDCPPLSGS